MSFKFIITFFIGLGVYLAIIGLITLIKFLKNKKKYKQELEEKAKEEEVKEVVTDGEEKQDNDNNA